ncbi:MAG: AraC family transcriptional regulator [Cyclobacteriaceae bacterium]|nr:AraC family transcriptional regulator [Cyclobacteriaceae bacterium]
MIYTTGIIITLFLLVLLLTKKEQTLSDKVLSFWLGVISIHLILFTLNNPKGNFYFPYLLGLEIPIPLLHGPLLFLYTTSLTSKRILKRKDLFHFIPYLIAQFSLIPFQIKTVAEKIFVYNNEGIGYTLQTTIIFISILTSGIIYTILSIRVLQMHKKKIKENYSYTEKINLQWLFNLIVGLSCIWLVVFFANDDYIFVSVVFYVLFIGYYGIKQVGIFTDQQPDVGFLMESDLSLKRGLSALENSKHDKSLPSLNHFENIHSELTKLMHKEKLFLTPELTLSMVSAHLNIHPNTLSAVINRVEEKNFFDYINTMRVEEFKERISKAENHSYTLLAIAHDCGFNSKTSFNRNFKNITGQSPSEYLKDHKITLNN